MGFEGQFHLATHRLRHVWYELTIEHAPVQDGDFFCFECPFEHSGDFVSMVDEHAVVGVECFGIGLSGFQHAGAEPEAWWGGASLGFGQVLICAAANVLYLEGAVMDGDSFEGGLRAVRCGVGVWGD